MRQCKTHRTGLWLVNRTAMCLECVRDNPECTCTVAGPRNPRSFDPQDFDVMDSDGCAQHDRPDVPYVRQIVGAPRAA